jgi:hypothetical protein
MSQPNAPNPAPNPAPGAAADPRVQAAATVAQELHEGRAPTGHVPPGAAASPISGFVSGVILDRLKGVAVEELQGLVLYIQARFNARIGGA